MSKKTNSDGAYRFQSRSHYKRNSAISKFRSIRGGEESPLFFYLIRRLCRHLLQQRRLKALDKTFIYSYNEIGNIVSVKEYDYTLNATPSGNPLTTSYSYNATHPDRLARYDYNNISYNSIGYPVSYGNKRFVWTKGKLTRLYDDVDDSSSYSSEDVRFTYDAYGRRLTKTYTYDPGDDYSGDFLTGSTTTYSYDHSGRLICEHRTEIYSESSDVTREFVYLYDESGVIGFVYTLNGTSSSYYYLRNLQGDVIGIYDVFGVKVCGYAYDAFGNCSIVYGSSNDLAYVNPIRYRGYYYDRETKLYYLNARYYNPEWRRFISPDSTAYLDPESANGLNLYAYCYNDPVNYCDPSGHWIETVFDVFFIGLDIYNLVTDEGWGKWQNWVALGVDVLFAVIPFAFSGSGQIVKLANLADDISDFYKITVVGETMSRVQTVSQFVNAADNIYDGFKAYDRLKDMGKGGKVLAEICGKADNIAWLYGKLRKGYTVVDIGIDVGRVNNKTGKLARSSSYMFERAFLFAWKYRTYWKILYHI